MWKENKKKPRVRQTKVSLVSSSSGTSSFLLSADGHLGFKIQWSFWYLLITWIHFWDMIDKDWGALIPEIYMSSNFINVHILSIRSNSSKECWLLFRWDPLEGQALQHWPINVLKMQFSQIHYAVLAFYGSFRECLCGKLKIFFQHSMLEWGWGPLSTAIYP